MERFKLDYFKCNASNLVSIEFESYQSFYDYFITLLRDDIVYLLSINETIFVTHDIGIVHYIPDWYAADWCYKRHGTQDVYLQEYSSYEEAYRVALSMQETNALCYDDGKNN